MAQKYTISILMQTINKATGPMRKIGQQMAVHAKKMSALGSKFSKNLTLPIVAGIGALTLAAKKAGDYADKLLDLEQITGLSVSTLQEFENVSRVAGVSFEGLSNMATKFSSKLPMIVAGTGEGSKAFEKLGVALFDANGNVKKADDLFPELISKLQGMENVTERNALAQQIFSARIGDLAPVLGLTTKQMKEAREEAHSMGLVMSRESLESANKFRIELAKTGKQLQMMAFEVGQAAMPFIRLLLPVLKKLVDIIKAVANWFGKLSPEIRKAITILLLLAAAIGPVLKLWGALVGLFSLIAMNPVTAGIIAIIVGLVFVATHIKQIIGFFKNLWSGIKKGAKKAFSGVRKAVRKVVKSPEMKAFVGINKKMGKVTEAIFTDWSKLPGLFKGIGSDIKTVLSPITDFFISVFDTIKAGIQFIMDKTKDLRDSFIEGFINPVKDAFKGLFEPFDKFFKKFDNFKVEGLFNKKSETEVKIKVTSDKGSTATIEGVKKKGLTDLKIFNEGLMGRTIPVGR